MAPAKPAQNHPAQDRRRPQGAHQPQRQSGSSTSAAPTCGWCVRRRGPSRASWPSRSTPTSRATPSASSTPPAAPPSSPSAPTRSFVAFRRPRQAVPHADRHQPQGHADDLRAERGPARRGGNDHGMGVGARRLEDDLRLPIATDTRTCISSRPTTPITRASRKRHRFKITQLTKTREAELGVSFLAGWEARRVHSRRQNCGRWRRTARTRRSSSIQCRSSITNGRPDSKWIVYARRDGKLRQRVLHRPRRGGDDRQFPSATSPRYADVQRRRGPGAPTAKKLCFLSDRRGRGGNLFVLDLEKPAAAGSTPAERPSFMSTWGMGQQGGAPHRLGRRPPARQVARHHHRRRGGHFRPDGSKVAYPRRGRRRPVGGEHELAGRITRLTTGQNCFPRQIHLGRSGAARSAASLGLRVFPRSQRPRAPRAGPAAARPRPGAPGQQPQRRSPSRSR